MECAVFDPPSSASIRPPAALYAPSVAKHFFTAGEEG